jgi:hypothetical protein
VDWLQFKSYVSELPVSKDALHIYGAFVVQVAAAFVARVPLSRFFPWFAVLAAAMINEGLDLMFEKEPYIHRWQIEGSIHDLVNTMMIPTVLMLLVRYVPPLFIRSEQLVRDSEISSESD